MLSISLFSYYEVIHFFCQDFLQFDFAFVRSNRDMEAHALQQIFKPGLVSCHFNYLVFAERPVRHDTSLEDFCLGNRDTSSECVMV